jgi:extradiol dioxygenase family protein
MFHLAFPVGNITEAKTFYEQGLGCSVGRETPRSLILNLGGHQIVAHVVDTPLEPQGSIYPRHFGLILETEAEWEALLDRAQTHNLKFCQHPKRRFSGSVLEHRTFFLEDPFHNLLEFKFYAHPEAIFGALDHAEIGDPV